MCDRASPGCVARVNALLNAHPLPPRTPPGPQAQKHFVKVLKEGGWVPPPQSRRTCINPNLTLPTVALPPSYKKRAVQVEWPHHARAPTAAHATSGDIPMPMDAGYSTRPRTPLGELMGEAHESRSPSGARGRAGGYPRDGDAWCPPTTLPALGNGLQQNGHMAVGRQFPSISATHLYRQEGTWQPFPATAMRNTSPDSVGGKDSNGSSPVDGFSNLHMLSLVADAYGRQAVGASE